MKILRFNENAGGVEYILHVDPTKFPNDNDKRYELYCDELFELKPTDRCGGISDILVYDPETDAAPHGGHPKHSVDFKVVGKLDAEKKQWQPAFADPNTKKPIWGIVLKSVELERFSKWKNYKSRTPFIQYDRDIFGTSRRLFIPVKFNFIEEIQRPSKEQPDDKVIYYDHVEFTLSVIANEGEQPKPMTWNMYIYVRTESTKKYSDLSTIATKLNGELKGSGIIGTLKAIEKVIMKDEDVANYFRNLVAKAKGQRFDL